MSHVIIGTAGHIDHGKTTLIKALTGKETDTLREEKERGISINLGFTYFDLPSSRRAGIVDVPGHEKFVKNMLAGVGGIDIVLLVIAADEGVMPQTREHLNILELLDIKKGIVVVTKKDMVDEEWLKLVTEDIKEEISTTFLKDSPIIPVSSVTGEGVKELIHKVDELTGEVDERDTVTDFRLPIDRVFTISGFGTVATGTLISGAIREGDPCEVYPRGIKTKVRGLQVHENSVKEAFAGQRVAVNLANIKTGEIERGDVISKSGSMENTVMLDCRLKYLKDASRPLKNRDRVRIYHGTSEILARVVILDKETIEPGEAGLIQLRLESTLAARRGDKFVMRSYSPMHTIGGGTILEPNPKKHKAMDAATIEELVTKEKGSPREIIEQTIEKNSSMFLKLDDIIRLAGKGIGDIKGLIDSLISEDKVYEIKLSEGNVYLHKNYLSQVKVKAFELLEAYHKNNPLKAGISKEEFKSRIFDKNIRQKLYDEILRIMERDAIGFSEKYIWKKDFEVKFDIRQSEIKETILRKLREAGFQPPKPDEVLKGFGREEKAANMVFEALLDTAVIIKLSEDIYMLSDLLLEAREKLTAHLRDKKEITAGEFRDLLGISRKYAVPILEYFDSIKLTKRVEDKRVLIEK